LFSYRNLEGVQTALNRINRRIKRKFSVELAILTLSDIYESMENDFRKFFPCLIEATERYRKNYQTFLA